MRALCMCSCVRAVVRLTGDLSHTTSERVILGFGSLFTKTEPWRDSADHSKNNSVR